MKPTVGLLLLLNIFLVIFLAPTGWAQDTLLDVPKLPSGVLSLPEPAKGSTAGTVIKTDTAPEFKAIIPPEMYRHIRSGELAVDAVARLQYVWRRDDKWEAKSAELAGMKHKLDANGLLDPKLILGEGFWFGSGAALNEEWEWIKDKPEEHSSLTFKILWNVVSNYAGLGLLDSEFIMQWLKDDKVYRRAAGELLRIFPAVMSSEEKSEQLFREKISFFDPPPLNRFALLTYRFRSVDEDMLWLYSPATQKVRQLTGSNRADSLVTSEISADDMLCFSGKIDGVKPTKLEQSVQLVPFPRIDLAPLTQTPDNCMQIQEREKSDGLGSLSTKWNFESHRFAEASGWAPTQMVYAPRELWRMELTSRDPYSLYGRQVLYVDVVTQLPVYKIVFDRAGRQWKSLICAFGLAATEDRSRKVPYLDSMVAADAENKEAYVMESGKTRYCGAYPEGISLSELVPSKLSPGQPATEPGELRQP